MRIGVHRFLAFILLLLTFCLKMLGCTIVVVAGSATDDGRPLLFKNRDSSNAYMVAMRIEQNSGFKFIAQYVIGSIYSEGPWGGFNEKGFCIANTISYNYSGATYAELNSVVLGRALAECETTDDFEKLIDGIEKPMDIRANYGVIDAHGHAAFYEVGPNGYTKYDANEAPDGILIRTNFSYAGDTDRKVGEDRLAAAHRFMDDAKLYEQVNARHILQELPRYLVKGDGTSLYDSAPATWDDEAKTDFEGFIPRYSTTNAMLIKGVKTDEDATLTLCWTMVGPPVATTAIPLFLTPGNILPEKSTATDGDAWLCRMGQDLKTVLFPYEEEDKSKFIDLSKLYNGEETGIMQRIVRIENEIISQSSGMIEDAYTEGALSEDALKDYYAWLDNYLEEQYKANFGDIITSIVSPYQDKNHQDVRMWDISGRRIDHLSNYRGIVVTKHGKYLRK